MILTNVFISVFLILNSINIINFNDKMDKYQLSVEKNNVLTLKHSDLEEKLCHDASEFVKNMTINEIKPKGILNRNFNKFYEEFRNYVYSKINILDQELEMLNNNSQAFSSEYLFQRNVHIKTELVSLTDKIDNLSLKQKKKLIYIEYINPESPKYDGTVGFSIIYNDKSDPVLLGTLVMPEYIGELETFLTAKSIDLYKSKYKIHSEYIYTEPLSYFDRYFLNSVGFK